MKIVHSPTMFKLIRDLNTDPESIPKNLEAMLFAIYGAAVMASTDEECMKHFGETRAVLGPKYLAATQRALSLAGVLKSTNLMVLQAFVLSLVRLSSFSAFHVSGLTFNSLPCKISTILERWYSWSRWLVISGSEWVFIVTARNLHFLPTMWRYAAGSGGSYSCCECK